MVEEIGEREVPKPKSFVRYKRARYGLGAALAMRGISPLVKFAMPVTPPKPLTPAVSGSKQSCVEGDRRIPSNIVVVSETPFSGSGRKLFAPSYSAAHAKPAANWARRSRAGNSFCGGSLQCSIGVVGSLGQ